MIEPYYEHNGITIYNGDCREIMSQLGKVDAVVTDPPYGVSIKANNGAPGGKWHKVGSHVNVDWDSDTSAARDIYKIGVDLYPDALWVLFGGNYFTDFLPPSRCWYIWDKERTGNYADVEMAWCSKDGNAKLFKHMWNGLCRESEIGQHYHPTQKPIAVMKWILQQHDTAQTILGPLHGQR